MRLFQKAIAPKTLAGQVGVAVNLALLLWAFSFSVFWLTLPHAPPMKEIYIRSYVCD